MSHSSVHHPKIRHHLLVLGLGVAGLLAVAFMLGDMLVSFAVSPPNVLPYQGRILNANGVPVADATANMQFRLYDSLAAGTCLWSNDSSSCATDDDQVVTLTDGLFSENLGDTGVGYAAILDTVFADDASVFLEVEINGEVLSPRKALGATAYAFNADTLDGLDESAFLDIAATNDPLTGVLTAANGDGTTPGLNFTGDTSAGIRWGIGPDTFPALIIDGGTTDTTVDVTADFFQVLRDSGDQVLATSVGGPTTSFVSIGSSTNTTALTMTGGVFTIANSAFTNAVSMSQDAGGFYIQQDASTDATRPIRIQSQASPAIYSQFFVDPINGFSFMINASGANGNVGIGTQTPDTALEILGSQDTEIIRLTDGDALDSVGIFMGDGTVGLDGALAGQAGSIFLDQDGKLWVNIDGATDWQDLTVAAAASTLQAAYDADANGGDVTITTNATDGDIVFAGDQDFRVTTTGNSIFDTSTFVVDATNNRIGIGDATPDHFVDIEAGSLASTISALNVTGTLSSTVASQVGINYSITGAGSGANVIVGLQSFLNGGFSGSDSSFGGYIANLSTGTATNGFLSNGSGVGGGGNFGAELVAAGVTAGHNIGSMSYAIGSSVLNIGGVGHATSSSGTPARQVGLFGSGRQGSSVNVGVWATNYNENAGASAVSALTSAALLADNADAANPIFIARDNGTTVLTIADGGGVSWTENATFGNASGDTVTSNAAAWTFANDTTVALSGGVDGINFDSNTLSIDATNNRIGIGDASPEHVLDIEAGTLTTGVSGLGVTGTIANPGTTFENLVSINASTAGTSNSGQVGLHLTMGAGFTGARSTFGALVVNSVAGTASTGVFGTNGNIGLEAQALGTSSTASVGLAGYAEGSTGFNVGALTQAYIAGSGVNIGNLSTAANSSGVEVAGFFMLRDGSAGNPSIASSAAFMADNGSFAEDIIVARDNGTEVFSIEDGGNIAATGLFRGGDGSATTPTYSWTSDTGIGMYRRSSGSIGIDATQMVLLTADATPLASSDFEVQKSEAGSATVLGVANNASTGNAEFLAYGGTSSSGASARFTAIGPGGAFNNLSAGTVAFLGSSFGSVLTSVQMLTGETAAPLIFGFNNYISTSREFLRMTDGTAGAVFNEDSLDRDFRVETDGNANGIFVDASAETIDLVGGSGSTGCSVDASGNLSCAGTISGGGGGGTAFVQNGNSFGATAVLGTNDTFGLALETDGTSHLAINTTGDVGIGALGPSAGLQLYVYDDNASTSATVTVGTRTDATKSGAISTGTNSLVGYDTFVNNSGVHTGGTINNFGARIDVTGTTNGTQTNTGLLVNVTGADTNYAALFTGGDVGIGDATPDALLDVAGSFQFDGDATFGDAATDNVVFTADVNSNILPNTDDTFDLGSTGQRWANLFLGPATLHVGTSATDEGTVSYDTSGNVLNFATDTTTNGDIAFFTDDLYIDKSSGFVGIGDATPSAMLSVGSTSQFQVDASGNITTSGTVASNGATTAIGDAVTDSLTIAAAIQGANALFFDGATDDTVETIFAITDPTVSDKTITFQNASGTVAFLSDIGAGFDSTAVDNTTWSDGANASNTWTFDVSGTDHTMVFGNGLVTFGDSLTVTDALNVSGVTTLAGSADGTDALVLTLGDILVTNGDLDVSAGDFNVTLDGTDDASITKTATGTAAEEGLEIFFNATTGTDVDQRALVIDVDSVDHSASTDIVVGLDIENLSGADAEGTETALRIGTGWDNLWTSANSSMTATGTMSSIRMLAGDGTAATPAYGFTSDAGEGMYREASNVLAFASGGNGKLYLDGGNGFATFSMVLRAQAGSTTFPSYSVGDDNTGIYGVAADNLGISTGGTLRFDVSTTAVTSTLPFLGPDGAQGTPTYSFSDDPNTGMYSAAADEINFAVGGDPRLRLAATFADVNVDFTHWADVTIEGGDMTINAPSAPATDMMVISNSGQATATSGADALFINYLAADGADLVNSAINVALTANGTASGDTMRGLFLDLVSVANASSTNKAIEIENTAAWDVDLELQNDERIDNVTDDVILLSGTGGTNNTSVTFDLDGASGTNVPAIVSGGSDLLTIFDGLSIGINGETTENISTGDFAISGGNDLYVDDKLGVNGNASIDGDVFVTGSLEATGGIAFSGDLLPSASPVAGATSQTKTTLDSDVGAALATGAIAIGGDELPVISYYDASSTGELKVIKCGDTACSSGNTTTTVDSNALAGVESSIAIGTDGFPVIAYHDNTDDDLEFIRCGNAACSSGNSTATLDSTGDVGNRTSIAIGTDGFPIVSYRAGTTLKAVKCGDASCSSGNTTTTLVNPVAAASNTSIAIGVDGLPLVAFIDGSDDPAIERCTTISCSTQTGTGGLEATVAQDVSLAIGSDGVPIVSYRDASNFALDVAHCGTTTCTSVTVTTINSADGDDSSIAIGTDGYAVISYFDHTAGGSDLVVSKCINLLCTAATTTDVDTSSADIGEEGAIAVGPDSLPIIIYNDDTNDDLLVIKCANPVCNITAGGAFADGADIGSPGQFFDNVYANSFWGKQIAIEGFDLAETYRVHDSSIEAGDIVRIAADQTGNGPYVEKSAGASDSGAIGVVSTKPGLALSEWKSDATSRPIGLAGRVPTKVSVENGPIAVGDAITTSSVSGVGMKATEAGPIVGYALEAFDGSVQGSVVVFLKAGYYAGSGTAPTAGTDNQASGFGSGGTADFTALNMSGNIYMAGNDIIDVEKISGLGGVWSVDATGKFTTAGSYDVVIKSYQDEDVVTHAVLATDHKLFLSGTAELTNGEAIVSFESVDPKFNDVTSTAAPLQVVVTPNGPAYVYVVSKDHNGFTVRQLNGSDSGITFDWMVTAFRKDYEPEAAEVPAEEPPIEEPPAEEPAPTEEPPVEEPVVEEPVVEEPPAEVPPEEPPAEEAPVEEPIEEPTPEPPPEELTTL